MSDRLTEIVMWRDVHLFRRHGDEGAATRLKQFGAIPWVVGAVDRMKPPSAEELEGCDLVGEPLDPEHSWWGFKGPSAFEIGARRRGMKGPF